MADIEIKRGYEVLPDNKVKFGIRVINNGDSAISDVEIILDYSHSLFELEGSKIEILGTIPPSIPRTAKFILKPLSCVHKEEIGATIRYKDHKWEKHTIDMRSKEVHCVCPFLKEKIITRSDFLKLFNEGYSEERGLNFENIQLEKITDFITHTCKNRLYKVDEFPLENGKIIYLAGDSIGEKAHYLLTAVIVEREGIVQVLFKAKSNKEFGIKGFLNEVVENLRHLVQISSDAKEVGVIKREQVINIIDSVVQHTNFSDEAKSSVNIRNSVVQRTNFNSSENENRKKETEERLFRQQQEIERLRKEKEKQDKLLRQKEEIYRQKEEDERKKREEKERQLKQKESEARLKQEMEELRKQREIEEKRRKEKEVLERQHREKQEQKRIEKEKEAQKEKEEPEKLSKQIESEIKKKEQKKSQGAQTRSEKDNVRTRAIIGIVGVIVGIIVIFTIFSSISSNSYNGNSSQSVGVSSSQLASVSSPQSASVQESYFQETGYDSSISSTFWDNERYTSIKIGNKYYVPLKSDSKNKLAQLILDLGDSYTLVEGDSLDLGDGYILEPKEIDVDNQKVWLEFYKDGEYVDDKIIDVGTDGSTWDIKLDDIQGADDVTVLKVHINKVFQDAAGSAVQINGLWGIDFKNAFIVTPGDELDGYKIMEANDNYISYKLSDSGEV